MHLQCALHFSPSTMSPSRKPEKVDTDDINDELEPVSSNLSAEDETILTQLHAKKIKLESAIEALQLLQNTLPAKRESDVVKKVSRFGCRISKPALVSYIENMTAGKKVKAQIKQLVDNARESIRRTQQTQAEMGAHEASVYEEGRPE